VPPTAIATSLTGVVNALFHIIGSHEGRWPLFRKLRAIYQEKVDSLLFFRPDLPVEWKNGSCVLPLFPFYSFVCRVFGLIGLHNL
jgi:hypothetical protein